MYFIFLLVLVAAIAVVSMVFSVPLIYIDIPSLLVLALLIVPMFIASGMGKEFRKIMKFMWSTKVKFERNEYRKMLEAINLLLKLTICAGLFTALLGAIALLAQLSDAAAIGPNVAVTMVSVFYMLFFCLIMYPIQAKLKVKLIEEE